MDIIQLLPVHIANQIAAGEVIQRPASAVKELLENALDAGASEINLFVKDSGKTLLQVVDNGSGMSKNDICMCFERHATSKIRNSTDLFNIHTMGFRGEAMASIAAISHVEIKSRLTKDELGSHLIIEGSEITKNVECATAIGTSVKIKNLFYNVPARRNFLKSNIVEMRHINEEFIRIALANPEIKMNLTHNNTEIFYLTKGNLRQRIVSIIGGKRNENLVPIKEETSVVNIGGYIGKPESAKKTRGEQYFFVNNRFIKDYNLHHAVTKAFEDLIPSKYYPSYFINLEVDPKLIDINIHPTKNEIKFEDDQAIYKIMRASIKRSLGQYNIAPSLDFSKELSFEIPYKMSKDAITKQPQIKIDKTYNPFRRLNESANIKNDNSNEHQKLVEQFRDEDKNENILQICGSYIAFSTTEGMIILDQNRAHRRILFEYYSSKISYNNGQSQQLLFPKEIVLNNKDIIIIKNLKTELLAVGFIFDIKTENIISISAIPPECQEDNLQFVIETLVEQHKNHEEIKTTQNNRVAISLALSLSISKNKKLTTVEMISLKNELEKCANSSICPTGRVTMINLKKSDLEKYF